MFGEVHDRFDDAVERGWRNKIRQGPDEGIGYLGRPRYSQQCAGNYSRRRTSNVGDGGKEQDATNEIEILHVLALNAFPMPLDYLEKDVCSHRMAHQDHFGFSSRILTYPPNLIVELVVDIFNLPSQSSQLCRHSGVLVIVAEAGERMTIDVEIGVRRG